jgi:hypothetical protein
MHDHHPLLKPIPKIAEKRPDPSAPAEREPKRLKAVHHLIMDYYIGGMSQTQIAAKVGLQFPAVNRIVNSQIFQHELARRRKEIKQEVAESVGSTVRRAKERLEEAAVDAAERLIRGLEDDGSLGITAAVKVLDRVAPVKTDEGAAGGGMKIDNAVILNLQGVLKEINDASSLVDNGPVAITSTSERLPDGENERRSTGGGNGEANGSNGGNDDSDEGGSVCG